MSSVAVRTCSICNHAMVHVFNALVLRRYTVAYFRCSDCGMISTEEPYWLAEAYKDAVVAADTGLLQRNFSISARLSVLLYYGFDPEGRYADLAGGYGVLVRLMRDVGFDFYWEDKYCRNEFARGFEVGQVEKPFTALTAVEVLEHLSDPCGWLQTQLRSYGATSIIFTTDTYDGSVPPELSWYYYSFETGQHISFYQRRTLHVIARRLRLHYWYLNGLHVFSADRPRNASLLQGLSRSLSLPLYIYVKTRKRSMTFKDHDALLQTISPNLEKA